MARMFTKTLRPTVKMPVTASPPEPTMAVPMDPTAAAHQTLAQAIQPPPTKTGMAKVMQTLLPVVTGMLAAHASGAPLAMGALAGYGAKKEEDAARQGQRVKFAEALIKAQPEPTTLEREYQFIRPLPPEEQRMAIGIKSAGLAYPTAGGNVLHRFAPHAPQQPSETAVIGKVEQYKRWVEGGQRGASPAVPTEEEANIYRGYMKKKNPFLGQ